MLYVRVTNSLHTNNNSNNNNNDEYLERLTHTGPKRLHIL